MAPRKAEAMEGNMTGLRLPLLVGSSQPVPLQEMGPSQGGSEQRWV